MVQYARTFNFLLGSATVMVGDPSELWDLTPEGHSLGLVNKVSFEVEPTFVRLNHGAPGRLIYSAKSGERSNLSLDAYEVTPRLLSYGLGTQLPSTASFQSTVYPLDSGIPNTTSTATFTSSADVRSDFPAGAWVAFQDAAPNENHVHYAQLTANTTKSGDVHTLTFADQPVTFGNYFSHGTRMMRVKEIPVGVIGNGASFVSVKIVGLLPYGQTPLVLLMPKVRITKGLQVSFNEEAFSKMALQFVPHPLLPNDPGYSEFGNAANTRVFIPKYPNAFQRASGSHLRNISRRYIRLPNGSFITVRVG